MMWWRSDGSGLLVAVSDHVPGGDAGPISRSFDRPIEACCGQVSGRRVAETAPVPDRDHHPGVELVEDRLEVVLADSEMLRAFVK